MKRIVENSIINNIPVTEYYEDTDAKRPLIFYIHGFTSNREDGIIDIGLQLSKRGFFVVSLDAYMHGDRLDNRFKNASEIEKQKMIFEIIIQTAKDITKLMDHYKNIKLVDVSRIGITGISMGGMITYFTAAHNPLIKVAVPLIGTPTFIDLAMYSFNEKSEDFFKEIKVLEQIDPIKFIQNFATKPLLILNGNKDKVVPIEGSRLAYNKLLPFYKNNEHKLKLIEYEVSHDTPPSMRLAMYDWFAKYL